MTIDKGRLEKRLADLRKDLKQAEANLYALGGAIQECEWVIAEWDNREDKALKEVK